MYGEVLSFVEASLERLFCGQLCVWTNTISMHTESRVLRYLLEIRTLYHGESMTVLATQTFVFSVPPMHRVVECCAAGQQHCHPHQQQTFDLQQHVRPVLSFRVRFRIGFGSVVALVGVVSVGWIVFCVAVIV